MRTCDRHYDSIVIYICNDCPFCGLEDCIEEKDAEIEELKDKIDNLAEEMTDILIKKGV